MPAWLQRDWCSSFVLTLGHFLWQGTLIAVVLAISLRATKSVAARYWLSLAALLVMAACPVVTLGWLMQPVDSGSGLQNSKLAGQVVEETRTLGSPILNFEDLTPASRDVGHVSNVPVIPSVPPVELNTDLSGRSPNLQPATDEQSWWQKFAPQLTTTYLCGVALMLLRLVFGLWGGRRLRRRVHLIDDPSLLGAMRRQAAALGLKLLPVLAYCERVTVPTVVGVLKPMILLPLTLTSGLSPEQMESVLAHELAHLRRCDHLVNLLQRVIESLLFFHPALWWVSHRIRDEREHCCDDLVVACGAMPLDYAKSLLVVAELSRASKLGRSVAAVSLLATGNQKPSNLRQRIARLLGESATPSLRVSPRALLLAIGIPILALIVTIQSGASNQPVFETDETSVENPQSDDDRNIANADRQGPRFTKELRLELKREAAHGGRWFFVDLDQGKLAKPPFPVELDRTNLPWTVIRPDEAALKKWLIESGVDLVLFAEPVPIAGKPGQWIERTSSWTIRTSRDSVNGLLAVPHVEGQEWRWNDRPELVIAPFARKNEAVNVSGFVPSSSGGPDIRPDSPALNAYRTAHNVVGFYLLEHNDLTTDSLDLRIVHVANATAPLSDQDFDGLLVSGKLGAADPPQVMKPIKAKLPNGVEVELAGVAMENVAYSDKSKWRKDDAWWRADGTRLKTLPMELFSSWGQETHKGFREFAIKLTPAGDAKSISASHVSWTPHPSHGSYGLSGWDLSAGKPGFLKVQHSAGFKDEKPVAVHVFVSDQPLGPAWLIDVNGLALPQKPVDEKTDSLRKLIQIVAIEKSDNETIFRNKRLPSELYERLEINLRAIDQKDQPHASNESRGSEAGEGRVFKLAAADIKHFEIRLRPMTQKVTFENVSLVPEQVTDVKVNVEAVDPLALSGLEFLKPYPKLHGLSLDMTEPRFLEIVKQQELKTRKTVEGEKVTHHFALGDGHSLIVMFDKEGKCKGIQRVRGDDEKVDDRGGVAPQLGDFQSPAKQAVATSPPKTRPQTVGENETTTSPTTVPSTTPVDDEFDGPVPTAASGYPVIKQISGERSDGWIACEFGLQYRVRAETTSLVAGELPLLFVDVRNRGTFKDMGLELHQSRHSVVAGGNRYERRDQPWAGVAPLEPEGKPLTLAFALSEDWKRVGETKTPLKLTQGKHRIALSLLIAPVYPSSDELQTTPALRKPIARSLVCRPIEIEIRSGAWPGPPGSLGLENIRREVIAIPDFHSPKVPANLQRLVHEHQPAAGEFLVKLIKSQDPGIQQAASVVFAEAWDSMNREQVESYLLATMTHFVWQRPQYPQGIDAMIGMGPQHRPGYLGLPPDQKYSAETITTLKLDGVQVDQPFKYPGLGPLSHWVKTKDLSLGQHTLQLATKFTFTRGTETYRGEFDSPEFVFEMVPANTPDDLIAPHDEQLDRLVREALLFAETEYALNHQPGSKNFDRLRPEPPESEKWSPQIRWGDNKLGLSSLHCPVWKLAKRLPVDLCFAVEFHIANSDTRIRCNDFVSLAVDGERGSYFSPHGFNTSAEMIKHADKDGFVTGRLVLKPSRAGALTDAKVKRYYGGEITSKPVRFKVVVSSNAPANQNR